MPCIGGYLVFAERFGYPVCFSRQGCFQIFFQSLCGNSLGGLNENLAVSVCITQEAVQKGEGKQRGGPSCMPQEEGVIGGNLSYIQFYGFPVYLQGYGISFLNAVF